MKRRWLLLLLGLLLASGLAFLIKDRVREAVLIPLLYLVWWAGVLVSALPQVVWWVLLVLVFLWAATRSLARDRNRTLAPARPETERLSRVDTWAEWIAEASHGDYFKWRLARELGELSLETLAQQEQLPLEKAKEYVQAGKLRLPYEIEGYLRLVLSARSWYDYAALRENFHAQGRAFPLDMDPGPLIDFLEQKMQNGR